MRFVFDESEILAIGIMKPVTYGLFFGLILRLMLGV